ASHDRVVADFNRFKCEFQRAIGDFASATMRNGCRVDWSAQATPTSLTQAESSADESRHVLEATDSAAERFRQGQSFQQQGDYDRAFGEYNAALRIDSDYLPAYLERGRLYRQTGQVEEAVADFTAAIQRDAHQAEPYLRRGNAHLAQNHYDE